MFEAISDGLTYLTAQSGASLVALFWFTLVFELPRYTLSFVAAALFGAGSDVPDAAADDVGRVTVVVAGHNEEGSIARCVDSLHEQSRPPDEIIVVSDGSTDGMPAKLRELQRDGRIDQAHCTHLRAGKSAAMNLAERYASGDVIVNVDCDCSYHRHALKRIVAPLGDPDVGAVSGNVLVRNPGASLTATFQAIEYLISISLGKQAAMLTDQVTCVSGAFGAFRRTALSSVNGVDVGGGEDLDLTLRLRKQGWKIHFARDSICYTDVPDTLKALVKQRFRWERDAVRLRYRKHLDMLNPFAPGFSFAELVHQLEFVFFHIVGAAMLPFYVVWLFLAYGDLALMILLAAQFGLLFLDITAFLLAALATPHANCLRLLPYVAGFGLFNGLFMRFVRLGSYVQEWILNASAQDNYVPEKVRLIRRW
ncbi:MAG: glycosyltransferase [Methyloligellaceae bacterium]